MIYILLSIGWGSYKVTFYKYHPTHKMYISVRYMIILQVDYYVNWHLKKNGTVVSLLLYWQQRR